MNKRNNTIDKTGQINYNNFGSKMIIIKYNNWNDVDIYFPEYNWTAERKNYKNFKDGKIKCPYEPRVYGKGYIGEGKWKSSVGRKKTKPYIVWSDMLRRCYNPEKHKNFPTYKYCDVCDEWLNFQNFAEWFHKHYYEILDERICLDKDILVKGNKIYSPNTCIFVPEKINLLFIKNQNKRGDNLIGTHPSGKGYQAQCGNNKSRLKTSLGTYPTKEEAFYAYKLYKENLIKELADEYYSKKLIPEEVYRGLYKYKVDITD